VRRRAEFCYQQLDALRSLRQQVRRDTALLAKGIRPEMARLTLARKIAAISLTIWKKGVDFDPKQLQRQAA
jgi:hypothetical protein